MNKNSSRVIDDFLDEKTKTCKMCGKEKPLDDENFQRNKKCPDGFINTCRGCSYVGRGRKVKQKGQLPPAKKTSKKQSVKQVEKVASRLEQSVDAFQETMFPADVAQQLPYNAFIKDIETRFVTAVVPEGLAVLRRVLSRYASVE